MFAYVHCRIRILNPNVTLYYAEIFPLVQIRIRIPIWVVSRMVTVPILGTDLHPNFTIFQSGNHSLNPNQWKNSA